MGYLPYQKQTYEERVRPLRQVMATIERHAANIAHAQDRCNLLLTEAKATKAYWSAIRLLARQDETWRRVYPHADDPLNTALNIGYTMLANMVRQAVRDHGFDSSIGVLHEPRDGKEALVYDLEELFRQPVVDSTILPLFTRQKQMQTITGKMIVHHVLKKLDQAHWHKHEWKKWKTIINLEIEQYLSAIQNDSLWTPTKLSWRHKTK